jgi:hypothetical protein
MINDPTGLRLNAGLASGVPGETELVADDGDLANIAVGYAGTGSYTQLMAGITPVFNSYGKAGLCASPANSDKGLQGGSLNDLTWPADPNSITPNPDAHSLTTVPMSTYDPNLPPVSSPRSPDDKYYMEGWNDDHSNSLTQCMADAPQVYKGQVGGSAYTQGCWDASKAGGNPAQ